jgi:hypothetical protein
VSVGSAGEIYLSTIGNFSVPGRSGANEDVFVFKPTRTGSTTQGSYDTVLYFDGSAAGLGSFDVKAIHVPRNGGTSSLRGGASPHRFGNSNPLPDTGNALMLGTVLTSDDAASQGAEGSASEEPPYRKRVVIIPSHQPAPIIAQIGSTGGVSRDVETLPRAEDLLYAEWGTIDEDSVLLNALLLLDIDRLLF